MFLVEGVDIRHEGKVYDFPSVDLTSSYMRILGFPVQIRPGFFLFMMLIVVVNGVPMGPWLAGSVAVFTLAHELGHAIAARRTGATASIALDFLAGYASFTPTRPLKRRERASISLAGPVVQIGLGIIVLLFMGVNPLVHDQFAADYSSFAIWWAGPIIGVFNLIPVLPLDGGNIAAEVIDYCAPGRGRQVMAKISPVMTAVGFLFMILVDDLRPLAAFAAILLVLQLQTLSGLGRSTSQNQRDLAISHHQLAMQAENTAWQTGRPGLLHGSQVLSPWWQAYALLRAGHSTPTEIIMSDLLNTDSASAVWCAPSGATAEQLMTLVAALPRPLPEPTVHTPSRSALALLLVLRRTEQFDEAARYGSLLFKVQPSSLVAIEVACCVARLGFLDTAAQWLVVAGRVDHDHQGASEILLTAIERSDELQSLRGRTDIEELIVQLKNKLPQS